MSNSQESNLNQGVENRLSSNLEVRTLGECHPKIFKGLQSTRVIHFYGMLNNLRVNKVHS